jgi:membrane-associated phospholipid phosphatase
MKSSPLRTRLRAHLGLKLAFAVGLNLWALAPYFWLQRHAFFPVIVMDESAVDIWLGFRPDSVWAYLSLFLLMPIAPMQMQSKSQLWRYAFGIAAMSAVADLIFLFWPTSVARPSNEVTNTVYQTLVALDMPRNAFPSLHAAVAVFSACCCEQIFYQSRTPWRWRAVLWTWVLTIIWAMLSTKQHVVVDALGGTVLGLFAYWCAFRKQTVAEIGPRLKLTRTEEWTQ